MARTTVLAVLFFAAVSASAQAQSVIPGGNGDGPGTLDRAKAFHSQVKLAMDSVLKKFSMGWNGHDAGFFTDIFDNNGVLHTRDDSARGKKQIRAMFDRIIPEFRRVTLELKDADAPDEEAWITASGTFEVRVDPRTIGKRAATVRMILHRNFPQGWQVTMATIDLPTADTLSLHQVTGPVEQRESNEVVPGDTVVRAGMLPTGIESFAEVIVHNGVHTVEHVVDRKIWRDTVDKVPTMHVVYDYSASGEEVADTLLLDPITMVPRSVAQHHGQRFADISFVGNLVKGERHNGKITEGITDALGESVFSIAELSLFAEMIPLSEGSSTAMVSYSPFDGTDLAHIVAGKQENVEIVPGISVPAVAVHVDGPGVDMMLWLDPTSHRALLIKSSESTGDRYWVRLIGGI